MKMKYCSSILILLIIVSACGPSYYSIEDQELTKRNFYQFYPRNISDVDSILIVSGSTGQRKLISDKQKVREWIRNVKDIEFQPNTLQENEYIELYVVTLLEKGEEKLSFTSNAMNESYCTNDEELLLQIQELFLSPDYESMVVLQIESSSIVVGPRATDPEASYPAYEILINDNTLVAGRKDSIKEIENGDIVKLWTDKSADNQEVAIKIKIQDE